MSRKDKQYLKLDRLEQEFQAKLTSAAAAAAEDSASQFFLSAEFNLWPQLEGRTDRTTDRLVAAAREILRLRTILHEDECCLAATFLSYCERFVDTSTPNRNGVRKHAAALLQEVQSPEQIPH